MNNNRLQSAALRLLALVLLVFSPHAFSAPEPNAVIEATGVSLSHLDVTLRPKVGKDVLRFQFRANEGTVAAGITLPGDAGANYEITAFGLDGKAANYGKGFIPPLREGDRPIEVPLPPTDLEKGNAGGLVVSLARERLVMESKASDGDDGASVDLQILDPRGNPVKLDPSAIKWGLTDPTHFELLPWKDRFRVEIRPVDTFPKPFRLCDVPPVVVACTSNGHCKPIRVCPDPWAAVSAGGDHTCALTKNGIAHCWGSNVQGQLGAPTTQSCSIGTSFSSKCSTRPLRVVCPAGAPCRFTQISAGQTLTVAIDTNGDTWWWGRGAPDHHRVSATQAGSPVGLVTVTAGYGHGCGISTKSEVWCWGTNAYGEAGAPLPVLEVPYTSAYRVLAPVKFRKVVAGGEHTCAIGSTGVDVVCWGRDDVNQTRGPSSTQFPAGNGQFFFQQFGGLTSILDVAASSSSSCVTLGNFNGVRCWGGTAYLNVMPFGTPDQLTVGFVHVCTTLSQLAMCVGPNNWGELGTGSLMNSSTPVPVNSPPALFAKVSAGDSHTCGLTPDSEIFCWGKNLSGQVGNGAANYGVRDPANVATP